MMDLLSGEWMKVESVLLLNPASEERVDIKRFPDGLLLT
jgi:hypothetical protein